MSDSLLAPWPSFADDEIEAVESALRSGRVNYWTGEEGKLFEREFVRVCDTLYAVAVANGTLALELALEASGIKSGDEVVVTPRTFLASASCVVRVGAKPIFADVCADSQNINADSIEAVLTPSTRAVVVVHHAGWPCDMDPIMELAESRNLIVIEDCAQAHGALYKDKSVGGLGHVGAFSFCQDKIITTGGEGGMLVTNDESIWKRAWSIKDHGKEYDLVFKKDHPPGFRWLSSSFGTNFRLTELQAAIGRVQLTKLETWHEQRNANAARIIAAMQPFGSLRVPVPPSAIRHAYYRLYAFVEPNHLENGWSRDRIIQEINAAGIPCFSGSCPEVYNEKAFDGTGLRPDAPLPVAHELGLTSLAFLVHPTLTEDDLDRTCAAIEKVMAAATR